MPGPQPDIAHDLATQLLGHIVNRFKDSDDKPAHAYVVNLDGIPADECCDGLAWVRVQQISVSDGSGAPLAEIRNIKIGIPGYTIILEAGVLRCFPGVDGSGEAPTPAEYTAGALQAAADRDVIRQAVICDLPADITANQCDGQIVQSWLPISGGGCSGGFLTTMIGYTDTLRF